MNPIRSGASRLALTLTTLSVVPDAVANCTQKHEEFRATIPRVEHIDTLSIAEADVRTVLPRRWLRPSVLAEHASPACADNWTTKSLSSAAISDDAWLYANDPGAQTPTWPITTFDVQVTTPPSGEWMVLFRFQDDHAPTGKEVPLDLFNTNQISDETQQRWYFYGYLEVP